jgi:hypothetical protein
LVDTSNATRKGQIASLNSRNIDVIGRKREGAEDTTAPKLATQIKLKKEMLTSAAIPSKPSQGSASQAPSNAAAEIGKDPHEDFQTNKKVLCKDHE